MLRLRRNGVRGMPKNGNRKGKDGERELAEYFRSRGYEARRGKQFSGGDDSPDVVHSLPGVHVECKRVENLNVIQALDQAIRDAGPGKKPVVFHRKNRTPWLVTLKAEDFFDLAELYLKFS